MFTEVLSAFRDLKTDIECGTLANIGQTELNWPVYAGMKL